MIPLLLACILAFFYNIRGDTECPNIQPNLTTTLNSFRLLQYNAEWLFIDYYQPMDCPGNGCTWKSIADAETHLSYVANILYELEPDIINICEIEGCDELALVNEALNNTFTPLLKKGTDTGTGQNVGMLTKVSPLLPLYRSEEKVAYPIAGSQCGNTSASGTTGVSKHYITEFAFGDLFVAMIGAHLLAIPTDPARCVQREAQAQVLQNVIVKYIQKGYEIIVIGDFNDYDAEVLDLNNNKPVSRVLDILKGLDGQYKQMYELTNIAYRIQQDDRFSDWWNSDGDCSTNTVDDFSMIDHILVTQNIDKRIVNAFIYHGYTEYCGKWNSDHYPLVVDFQL